VSERRRLRWLSVACAAALALIAGSAPACGFRGLVSRASLSVRLEDRQPEHPTPVRAEPVEAHSFPSTGTAKKGASTSSARTDLNQSRWDSSLPALTGRVVDDADLLTPEAEQTLTRRLAALEQLNSDQFVVVTVKSLGGETIEDFSQRLGNVWGIGQKTLNKGVLLVVAPTEHKVRIAVGYGLESVLTNALCQSIIDQKIIPHFKNGEMQLGILAGADAILQHLTVQPMKKAA